MNKELLILIFLWYAFWGIYNYLLVTKEGQRKDAPLSVSFSFYIFSILIIYISKSQDIFSFPLYLLAITIILILNILIKSKYLVMLMNSITQMTWLYVISHVLDFSILNTTLVFGLSHVLVVFLRHVSLSGRALLILLSVIGGFVLVNIFSIFNYPYNFILTIVIHWGFYQALRPIDRKYKFNIVTD